jgi:hypothetical protein
VTQSFSDSLREASEFFAKRGRVYDTLRRITRRLREEHIDYVVVGAMALVMHGFKRFTTNVDLLITSDGLNALHQRVVGDGYTADARKKLRYTRTGVSVRFLAAGDYPGDGTPNPSDFLIREKSPLSATALT